MKHHFLLLAAIFLSSCATIAPPAKPGTVDHIVLVWLKRPGSADDKQALIESGKELRAIPGIRFLDSGIALPSERPIVDDSFDVGFVMRFESKAALAAYSVHPTHMKAKEKLLRLSNRIVVYDVTR
jgi:hypothetical protein